MCRRREGALGALLGACDGNYRARLRPSRLRVSCDAPGAALLAAFACRRTSGDFVAKHRWQAPTTLLVSLGLVAAACGGDNNGSTAATTAGTTAAPTTAAASSAPTSGGPTTTAA